jgi:transcriptional regulator with XRE-family HTH domain
MEGGGIMATRKGENMGQRLNRLRDAAKMTQVELAERSGTPVSSLRKYEQNKALPRIDHAARLAVALGCSLDELAGIVGPKRKK